MAAACEACFDAGAGRVIGVVLDGFGKRSALREMLERLGIGANLGEDFSGKQNKRGKHAHLNLSRRFGEYEVAATQ